MASETSIEIFNGNEYNEILRQAVAVIEQSRAAIARSIVTNITNSHWKIGKLLHERKLDSKYGAGVVKQLSADLKLRYPSMGLSTRNLWLMKKFYLRFYQSDTKLLRSVALLPWRQTLMLTASPTTASSSRRKNLDCWCRRSWRNSERARMTKAKPIP